MCIPSIVVVFLSVCLYISTWCFKLLSFFLFNFFHKERKFCFGYGLHSFIYVILCIWLILVSIISLVFLSIFAVILEKLVLCWIELPEFLFTLDFCHSYLTSNTLAVHLFTVCQDKKKNLWAVTRSFNLVYWSLIIIIIFCLHNELIPFHLCIRWLDAIWSDAWPSCCQGS